MIIHNKQIADKFEKIANYLDIQDANRFRVRSYRKAARTIRGLSNRIQEMVENEEDIQDLADIGKDLAKKIKQVVKTGTISLLERLEEELPTSLLELLEIDGIGPKSVSRLYNELGVENKKDLLRAIKNNELRKIDGFGKKSVNKLKNNINNQGNNKKGLKQEAKNINRLRIDEAESLITPFYNYMKNIPTVDKIYIAGSFRRRSETVGDIDLLIISKKSRKVISKFTEYEEIKKVISEGDTKSSVQLNTGLQVDLRVVEKESEASALLYFTGNKSHNVSIRKLAQKKDYKLNEYGLFKKKKKIEVKTEKSIYNKLNLNYIPPELRENRGEIESSKNDNLPKLVQLEDIRGDLQMHTSNSDGSNTIEEMVKSCMEKGYEYIAITDHSSYIGVTQGLDNKEINNQIKRIHKIDKKYKDIKVLTSIEVDILKDGSLDLEQKNLKNLDLVVMSIHSYFDLTREEQTDRIINAMDNPYIDIFAHPTGRKVGKRDPYDYDFQRVVKKAIDKNILLEINASPQRLDLNSKNIKIANDLGVKFVISTDAHNKEELNNMKYGVWQAQRGWAEAKHVKNTLHLEDFQKEVLD